MALSIFLFLTLISARLVTAHYSAAHHDKKAYIVYMGHTLEEEFSTQSRHHVNMLQQVVGSEIAGQSLVHSYKRSFNGFVAMLTEKEAQEIGKKKNVVSVFASGKQKLETTKSWDFIGFPRQVKRSRVESDIIIGVIDSGIWPDSTSFDDHGFGPPPPHWRGSCQVSESFKCNNKIIGARYYRSEGFFNKDDHKSPLDSDGHGTHTASTAAGSVVKESNLLGFGSGTARGGVPSARIAVYKVCWNGDCHDADIMAAFDDAVADGVDIITASLGSPPVDYFSNVNAIGAFHAMRKGILTTFSAGNRGPELMTVGNIAPWSLTVTATSIDRDFTTTVQLGNNSTYEGKSINTFDLNNQMYPMIHGRDAPNTSAGFVSSESRYCYANSLDKKLVNGKILFCDGNFHDMVDGAIGIVSLGDGDVAETFPMPSSSLSFKEFTKTYTYMNSTRKPMASIWRSNERSNKLAPYVPMFSSRGPNPVTPNILKPDLAAPGVYILAAWPTYVPISNVEGDKRSTAHNIQSGTSMACPHAAAAAAYVRSFHPTWSPAAIKSSLMTSATPISATVNPEAEFAYGAGQINPRKARNTGLVYDISEEDYIKFLCGLGYNSKLLQMVTGNIKSSCPQTGKSLDLNYPAFVLSASPSESIDHVSHRTVTNVGSPNSTYKARWVVPLGLKITVNPNVLSFSSTGEKRSYSLTVRGVIDKRFLLSALLVWDDGTYQVRSPIVVYIPT